VANVIVSNVPGPKEALYWGDNRLSAFYSVGPLTEGVGINFTAYSYGDRFNVSVLTDPRMVPDPWHLLDLFDASLEDLRKATPQGTSES
jgi:diacylglycerol O-acyltransferase